MPETRTLPLAVDMPENDRRQDYIRAVCVRQPDGSVAVEPLGRQDPRCCEISVRQSC